MTTEKAESASNTAVYIVRKEKYGLVIMAKGRRGENGFNYFVIPNDFANDEIVIKSEHICQVFSHRGNEHGFATF